MKPEDLVPHDVSQTKFEIPDLQEISTRLATEQA
jgi:hypothetical protein